MAKFGNSSVSAGLEPLHPIQACLFMFPFLTECAGAKTWCSLFGSFSRLVR